MNVRLVMCVAALLLTVGDVGSAFGSESSETAPPLFVYSFTGNPEIQHDLGIIVSILLELGEVPNKPLREKLNAALGQRNREERFRDVLGCALVEDASKGCRKVVFLVKPPFEADWIPSDELREAIQREDAGDAWAIHLTEQFHVGGYFLSAVASKIYVDSKNRERIHRVHAMYWTSYSKQLDAMLRSVGLKQKGVMPPLGSKEAKAGFWYGGTPSRLESEIDKSPAALAELLSVVMSLPVGSRSVSPVEKFSLLPKLRSLRSRGEASCSGAYCGTRVRQEFADRIHVEMTGSKDHGCYRFHDGKDKRV